MTTTTRHISDLSKEPPIFVDIETVADTLGISRNKLLKLRADGAFPRGYGFGPRSMRWHYQEVIAWALLSRGRRPATHHSWEKIRVEYGFGHDANAATASPTPATPREPARPHR